jgi:hypothetical protein
MSWSGIRSRRKNCTCFLSTWKKAYDKIPRNLMSWALDKHKVPTKHKGRIWCREETVHGGFAKFCTLSRPNRPLNPGRSKPPRVRRGLTLRGVPRARPHANPHAPSAVPCPHPRHGYKAHPSARPSSPLPPLYHA